MLLYALVSLIVALLIGILVFYLWIYSYKGLHKLPSPPLYPLIANVLEFLDVAESIHKYFMCIQRIQTKYGKKLCLIWTIKWVPFLLITDIHIVEYFLNSTKHINKALEYTLLKPWLGDGLLLSTGTKWHKRRKILTPAFHFKILEEFIDVFNKNGNILIEKLTKKLDHEIDIFSFINVYALDVVCETAMGTTINAQTNENLAYVKSTRNILKLVADKFFSPWKNFDILYKWSSGSKQEEKEIEVLHNFSLSVIEKRRNELLQNENKEDTFVNPKRKMAFLDLLLQATQDGKPFSNEDIREEVDTFMFEGHDTVSSTLSFAIYMIGKNPDVQQKIFEELCEVMEGNLEREFTIVELQKLNYTEMVIKETLRLFPPVAIYVRELGEDVLISADITKTEAMFLPKGVRVAINAYALHRNEEFYPEPEKFIPERFLKENVAKLSPFAYIPFSAGLRNCIGQRFAMLEMKATIMKLLKNFVIHAVANHEIEVYSDTILKSFNGLPVRMTRREY